MTNNGKFFPDQCFVDGDNFNFEAPIGTDIDIFWDEDDITIKVDEHQRGWERRCRCH